MAVKKNVNPFDLVKDIVKIASETKAIDMNVINIQGVSSLADYIVIASARSQRQVQGIAHNITEKLTAIPIDFAQNLCYPKAINQTTPPLAESTHRQVRRTSWADVYRSTASGKSFSHHSIEIVPFGNY